MKAKKILLSIVFLVAFLIYTPVYALSGVSIQDVEITGQRGNVIVDELDFHDNVIETNLTFTEENDFVIFDVKLKNEDDVIYQLQDIVGSFSDYLSIHSDDIDKVIEPGQELTTKFQIIYDKFAYNQEEVSLDNSTITFFYAESIENPDTGFHVISLIFLIFVICLFPVMFFKIKKRYLVLLFVLVPLVVFATEEVNVQMVLRDVTVKGRLLDYTIIVDDGTDGEQQTIIRTYGQTVGELVGPDKLGYEFDHWEDQEGNEVGPDTVVEGNMRITAKFNPIHYSLNYNYDHGSASNPSTYTIEDQITITNPTRTGYNFIGWSEGDSEEIIPVYTIYPGTHENITLVAHWSAQSNIGYKVIHQKQKLVGNEYEVEEIEELAGEAGASVTPQPRQYTGFRSPAAVTRTIAPDGSLEITYSYDREEYTFTIPDRTYVNEGSSTANGTYRYGTQIHVTATTRNGYVFTWSDGDTSGYNRTFTLTNDKTISLIYTLDSVQYKVVSHLMGTDGTYEHETTVSSYKESAPGTKTITPDDREGFYTPEAKTATILADGSTVVEFNYARRQYNVTFINYRNMACNENSSDGSKCYSTNGSYHDASVGLYEYGETSKNYYYGQKLYLDRPSFTGYDVDWYSSSCSYSYCTYTVPAYNSSVGLTISAREVSYYVVIYADGSESSYTEHAYAGSEVTMYPPSKRGYDPKSSDSQTKTISGYGSTRFYFEYDKITYTIRFTNSDYMACKTATGSCYYSYFDPDNYDYEYGYGYDWEDDTDEYIYDYDEDSVTYDAGTTVYLTAAERPGYNFHWSSSRCSDDSYECSFEVDTNGISVGPVYTPGTVNYKVYELFELFSSGNYATRSNYTYSATTNSYVTPEVSSYTGFYSPSPKTITVSGNGRSSVSYQYSRRSYTLYISNDSYYVSFCQQDSYSTYSCYYDSYDYYSSASSYETIYYGDLYLRAASISGYDFDGWSDGESNRYHPSISVSGDVYVYPIYRESYIKLDIDYDYEYVDIAVDGGSYSSASSYNEVCRGSCTVKLRANAKPGYSFEGWYYEGNTRSGRTIEIDVNEDSSIYPIYIENVPTLYEAMRRLSFEGYTEAYDGTHGDNFTTSSSRNIYQYATEGDYDDKEELRDQNNVVFAGYCWQMVRTTDTGGVKLLYNGPYDDIYKCSHTNRESFTYISTSGSYYDDIMQEESLYGTDFVFENGVFALQHPTTITMTDSWSNVDPTPYIDKYMCEDHSSVCTTLFKIEGKDDDKVVVTEYGVVGLPDYAIGVTSFNDDLLPSRIGYKYNDSMDSSFANGPSSSLYQSMLNDSNINVKDSNVKTMLEDWYEDHLLAYDDFIDDDVIYCYDRSPGYSNSTYVDFHRMTGHYCSRSKDRYSVNNTSASLKYGIGLLTDYESQSFAYDYEDYDELGFWLGNPSSISYSDDHYDIEGFYYNPHYNTDDGVGEAKVNSKKFVRPVITLKTDTEYYKGNGSKMNPYYVDIGYRVTMNSYSYGVDSLGNQLDSLNVPFGETVIIDSDTYTVNSFRLDGETVSGNSFVMPKHDVTITNISTSYTARHISYADSNVKGPSYMKSGKLVTMYYGTSGYIRSFQMNGQLMVGNTFIMPDESVEITDVEYYLPTSVESKHDPYNPNIDTIYFDHTYSGARSITVNLMYQTDAYGDSVYLYDGNNTEYQYQSSTKKTETIVINGDYLKIRFVTDAYNSNYYGFKAIITPNY